MMFTWHYKGEDFDFGSDGKNITPWKTGFYYKGKG